MPLRVSALRTLGAYMNIFAIESFMDELAAAARADPAEFRLRHLSDPRARAVIEAAIKLMGTNGIEAIVLLILGAWAAGWLLGGPEIRNRKVLAISTSMRNVGVCLPIASSYFAGTEFRVLLPAHPETHAVAVNGTCVARDAASTMIADAATSPPGRGERAAG